MIRHIRWHEKQAKNRLWFADRQAIGGLTTGLVGEKTESHSLNSEQPEDDGSSRVTEKIN